LFLDAVVDVVAFNAKDSYTRPELFAVVRNELMHRANKPTILVFPELALGKEPLPREETRVFLLRLNKLLAAHKEAFVFFSLLRKTKLRTLPALNSGYIVTPDKKKPWFSYPKVASWMDDGPWWRRKEQRPSGFDKKLIDDALDAKFGKDNTTDYERRVAIDSWIRATRLVKEFPSIFVRGTHFQLRVCADSCRHELAHENIRLNAHKPDVVLVPAKNLYPDDPDFATWKRKIGKNSSMVIVDGHKKTTRISHGPSGKIIYHEVGSFPVNGNVRVENASPFRPRKRTFHPRP